MSHVGPCSSERKTTASSSISHSSHKTECTGRGQDTSVATVQVGILDQVHMHLGLKQEKGFKKRHQLPLSVTSPSLLGLPTSLQAYLRCPLSGFPGKDNGENGEGPTDPTKQHQDEMIVKPEPSGLRARSNR